ncbi:transposase [Ideonella sp. DXS29W]|uniref:Transposase n=1 Tax=Ideonella lacteola TaxID=2984193 RepID=A0ABU9BQE5_9BURK
MARQARTSFPNHVHHLLVRGHNRELIAVDDDDRRLLMSHVVGAFKEHGVALHAFVLMPNHLHLLATPGSAEGIGRSMQSMGRRYVAAFNARHERTGTLWEGRYRAHMVGGDDHVLRCMRFIELNPNRVGLAPGLLDYTWSSLAHHLGATRDSSITEPPAYWRLGNTPFEREAAYRQYLEAGIGGQEALEILAALTSGRPWGNSAYLREVEKIAGHSLVARPRGRPRKSAD